MSTSLDRKDVGPGVGKSVWGEYNIARRPSGGLPLPSLSREFALSRLFQSPEDSTTKALMA